MVKQVLLAACVAASMSAFAAGGTHFAGKVEAPERVDGFKFSQIPVMEAKINDGSVGVSAQKAPAARPQWKRPAGQFWGTGFSLAEMQLGYYYTPLVLRPFVNYDFQNVSTVGASNPSWSVMYWDDETNTYVTDETDVTDLKVSYQWGVSGLAPILSYSGFEGYPAQYYGKELTEEAGNLQLAVGKDIAQIWQLGGQPVSSHYWSMFSRNPVTQGIGVVAYSGATPYKGDDRGWWFGTNADGINAAATRFEKPDQPYLLNSVYWYYMFSGDIVDEIPLTAYVFKTANDAKEVTFESSTTGQEVTVENLELGELIAVSQSVIPMRKFSENDAEGLVQFNFVEKNPVTGAETAVSLEIDDDITVVVVGFNAPTSNGTFITSCMSNDDYDEGYGNLGFLGSFELTEDGYIQYDMRAIKHFFASEMPNTVLGVLADVTYPWILPEMDTDVHLPNEGETTQTEVGLQYPFYFASTSMTDDFEVTYNGEEECDWLQIIDVDDVMYINEDGEEEFAGECGLLFEATPNPEDLDRTCVVKITIPAATCEITFRQGTKNTAVEVVTVDGDAQYFDLQGRRVANPVKGLYIKKSGNKTTKVIL